MGHLMVTVGHLRVTVGHPRVTIGHLRVTIGHIRVTIGYPLKIDCKVKKQTVCSMGVPSVCLNTLK